MNEEEIREAAAELESYRTQLDSLKQQEAMLRSMNDEFMQARDTLISLKEQKADDELLIPIGANCFIFAKVDDAQKTIISLGSNVAAETTTEKAIEDLDKRIAEFSDAGTQIAQRMQELDAKSQTLAATLQKEYAKHMQ